MKITILIEEATEEEARRILQGPQTTVQIQNHQPRDPTRMSCFGNKSLRETGCEGCEFIPECESKIKADSKGTPPAKTPPTPKEVVAVSKKTAPVEEPLKKVVWTGKKTKAHGPMRPGPRADNPLKKPDEKEPRQKTRVSKYGLPTELYQNNKKEYQRLFAICKAHDLTYEQALVYKRGKPGRKPGKINKFTVIESAQAIAPSNETKVSRWTPEEDAAIRDCPSEDAALARYLDKFPDSERTAAEVMMRWSETAANPVSDEAAGETA